MNEYYESEGMLQACHHYIENKIFPIIYAVSENSGYVRGTGFTIEHNGTIYLLTARHVLEEDCGIEYDRIVFPIYGQNKGTMSLPAKPYMSKIDSNADLAVVPLLYEDEIIDKMYWKPFNIDSFFLKDKLYTNQAVFVNGFPREMQIDLNGNPNISIGSLGFLTKIYTNDLNEVDNYDDKIDIVFEYRESIMVDGEETKIPSLKGMSGSPMFCIDHTIEGVWSPEKNLKIIGIEKAVKRNKYIKATNSICLRESLIKLLDRINN